jgi:NADH dehydrogenase [ubiquinone] 1 alpha subcomplex assembly factor 1
MKPKIHILAFSTLFFWVLSLSIHPEVQGAKKKNKDKGEGETIFDFTEENPGEKWITVNDNVMGGRSKGGFSFKKTKLVFSGSTNTNGGGFSSIRSKTMDLGLEDKDGLMIRFKGDGRSYNLGVRMDRSSVSYRTEFETDAEVKGWQVAKVPFESLSSSWRGMRLPKDRYPLKMDKVRSVTIMIYDKKDGPFNLQVDWIKAYSDKK